MNRIKNFFKDESGLELTEYAVAAALITAVLVTAFTQLGAQIKVVIDGLKTAIGG